MSGGLKPIGPAVAAAAKNKHREWLWCRRNNGFSDKPLWREIGAELGLPIHQVVAFANRLEELANHAGNVGHNRGYVGHFRASEFAAALGMATEDAARIYAALEQLEIGWIVEGHVADFYDRNRDGDDVDDKTQAERARRSRAFRAAIKELNRQRSVAMIGAELYAERMLEIATMKELAREGVLAEGDMRRRLFELQYGALSTAAGRHSASHRDAVTVTTEHTSAKADNTSPAVDDSGDATRGSAAGLALEQNREAAEVSTAEVELWLAEEGKRIVVERMDVPPPRAETLIERWRRDVGVQDVADAIAGADRRGLTGGAFHVTVSDAMERARRLKQDGRPLPLPPVGLGPASPQVTRHDVTDAPVDNTATESPKRSGTDG